MRSKELGEAEKVGLFPTGANTDPAQCTPALSAVNPESEASLSSLEGNTSHVAGPPTALRDSPEHHPVLALSLLNQPSQHFLL